MNQSFDKIKSAFESIDGGYQEMQKGQRILSGGPASFYFKKVEGYVEALFGQFAPFQIGDRVVMTKRPKCVNGWARCKHFLVKGAIGTVHDVDYYDGHFCADVVWDNETWISSKDGKERPTSQKHTFRMWENQIKRLDP